MTRPDVSVIIASDRSARTLEACLGSLASQRNAPPFEVLVASKEEPPAGGPLLVGWVRCPDPNPALRRNRAADFAAGEWLAFLDDDARASPDWLARAMEISTHARLFGGRDLPPPGAALAERISDLLLATPVIGSRIAAHERAPRDGSIRRPSDLALCNLFVARSLFDSLGGFDESLGYIGEDTDFVARAVAAGERPEIRSSLVVYHDRRRFPLAFLRQRWRYRWKTGRLLVQRPAPLPKGLIYGFLASGLVALALAGWMGRSFIAAAAAYAIAVWWLSFPLWRRDLVLFPIAPFAFALHHATYWVATASGLLWGLGKSALRRPAPERAATKAAR